ncbi:MAG: ATP-binding cassette domain-containing protein [Myxococcales bacterium]|nr:ATP-binding cassette domain-containing protein [Myxococcales bacterium]
MTEVGTVMSTVVSTPPALLEARAIEARRDGVPILRNVDLVVRAGEVVALLGPSGAGKTSLFRVLVGEERAEAGQVLFEGVDISREPLHVRARRGVGYLPQGPSVLFDLTVRDNLRTFAKLVGRRVEDVLALAERCEIDGRLGVRAGDLSGGERRRLELARALSARPRVLVCDEPWSGVDPAGAERLVALLRGLAREERVGIVLADHHVHEALALADVVVLLVDGVVEMRGTPTEFAEHPLAQGRYLGHWQVTGRSSLI